MAVIKAMEQFKPKVVVEIGPGKGALTKHLLEKDIKVIAIEKDASLVRHLKEKFKDDVNNEQLQILHTDARDFQSIQSIPSGLYNVVANIPYYITGLLLRVILSSDNPPTNMTLVIQKEVAERIVSKDRGKESLLSLSVKLFGKPKYIKTLSRVMFSPKPNVSSSIITITDIHPVNERIQKEFFNIITKAFAEKRKVVLKKFQSDEKIYTLLRDAGVTQTTRAEDIPFTLWHEIAQKLV